ncbi:MAG: hypothetical protein ACJAYR_000299 [Sneathiella sp.]
MIKAGDFFTGFFFWAISSSAEKGTLCPSIFSGHPISEIRKMAVYKGSVFGPVLAWERSCKYGERSMTIPETVSLEANTDTTHQADPIIDREEVMWAARKLILVYGDQAPLAADNEVRKFDAVGKFHVATMFERVRDECSVLLQKSAKLRARRLH